MTTVVEIPDGWKLVPVTPTPEMVENAMLAWRARVSRKVANGTIGADATGSMIANYQAMLEQAPPLATPTPRDAS